MTATVVMYSHDSVGLGHARRNRALAYALAEGLPRLTGEDVGGLLIAGHPDATQDSLPPGWDWLVLPGFARTPGGYAARNLPLSVGRLAEVRGAAIESALDAMSPDLFIADRHPFGVDKELREALQTLRTGHSCATVLGMRDVLDTPEAVRGEWGGRKSIARVAEAYDAIWVYGDRGVYDPVATGEIPPQLAAHCGFTGYLSRGRPNDEGQAVPKPYVLTMVGGGSDGGDLARASARADVPEGHRHILVTGPQMPIEEVDEVRRRATPGTRVERSLPNVPTLIRDAAAVVTMGGYNSMAEVMATSTPALVVPRASRRAEQRLRAAALAGAGAVEALAPEDCTPGAIGAWFAGAVGRRSLREGIELDGLQNVASLAAALISERRGTPERVRAYAV